ncbi:hypothetical protein LINGRAHAP2_LOCUS24282, partial [Linum grandiflorum]
SIPLLSLCASLVRLESLFRVDRATEEGALVCVEINLSKRLLPIYKVAGVTYLIVYEGFHKFCTNCGMCGAPSHLCHCRVSQEVDPMIPEPEESQ